ncbi:fumarylacetoacetate hydrolase family protein [Embleya sp. NPDC001921]
MRLATVSHDGTTSAALVEDDRFAPVRSLPGREDATDVAVLIARPLAPAEAELLRGRLRSLAGTRLLPPILRPPKNVLCVGKNYVEHVREGAYAEGVRFEIPDEPIWFTKAHTALAGHGGTIPWDPEFTEQLDYEGELAVVIGKSGRHIRRERALDHVFGYTILNDVTARDRQQRHKQWFVGKSADGYAPLGPWVVTADAIPDPQNLTIETTVDGEIRQSDTTANMIFDVATLIAGISTGLTLEPGDVIGTGTPPGVAWGTGRFLRPGSTVAVAVEGIGRLASEVGAVASPS